MINDFDLINKTPLNTMKILYDHRVFSVQRYGGISRYFYETIKRLNTFDDVTTKLSLLISKNEYISKKDISSHFSNYTDKNFKGKYKILYFINKSNSIFDIKSGDFDLFHPTYYEPYFLKHLKNKPFILTVYDNINERYSDLFPKKDNTIEKKELLIKKATKIIAISENTKKDIIDIYNIASDKIDVIYLGSTLGNISTIKKNENPSKYFLYVGSRYKYKNFINLVYSISDLISKDKNLYLYCAGGVAFDAQELGLLKKLNLENNVKQFNLTDQKLIEMYSNAIAFIYPSLYEGFGIPILEAFACKTPVLCSNTSSLPEVAGNAALYFNPSDVDDIRRTIENIYCNNNLRDELIIKGDLQLKKFSWEKTAAKTYETYRSIL